MRGSDTGSGVFLPMSSQIRSAASRLAAHTRNALIPPIDVPETALKRVMPKAVSAFQQPISYAPFAPPPLSTRPTECLSQNGGATLALGNSPTRNGSAILFAHRSSYFAAAGERERNGGPAAHNPPTIHPEAPT